MHVPAMPLHDPKSTGGKGPRAYQGTGNVRESQKDILIVLSRRLNSDEDTRGCLCMSIDLDLVAQTTAAEVEADIMYMSSQASAMT